MGTRSDWYIGRGETAEWLGSAAWDGYPNGIAPINGDYPEGEHLFNATTESEFRARLEEYFEGRRDVTRPEQGWPWPWEDSQTTDYAYAFDNGKVWASCFGHEWFDPLSEEPEPSESNEHPSQKVAIFPDMTARKKVTLGPRSGVIVFGLSEFGAEGKPNG